MKTALLAMALLGATLGGFAVWLLQPAPVVYHSGQRNYKVMTPGKEANFLRADRIERRDGCVLFYRHERIDTILCEGVSALVVTEIIE